jgi:hypothetical protein
LRHTFHVPRRFHPAYSLLGRGLRRRVGDARRAEALFLVTLSLLALGLLLAQFAAWTWLKPAITAEPLGPMAVAFWIAQLGALILTGSICVVGFTPPLSVMLTPTQVELRRGRHERLVPYAEITAVASISALLYHRHYSRYAATDVFVNRLPPRVLLLHTPAAPIALGLLPEDHDTVMRLLEDRLTPTFEASIAQVA